MDKKRVEPTPDHFESYEAAAEFWDTHDTTDYLDEFRTVEVTTELRVRHFEIEIDEAVARDLQAQAITKGVKVGELASRLLWQQLDVAA